MATSFVTLSWQLLGAKPGNSSTLEEITALVEASQSLPLFHIYNEVERAEIHSWVDFSKVSIGMEGLQKFDTILLKKSYLVGHRFTIADVLVFAALHEQKLVDSAVGLVNIARWFDHIQHLVTANVVPMKAITQRAFVFPVLDSVAVTTQPPAAPEVKSSKKEASAEKSQDKKEKGEKKSSEKKEKTEKPVEKKEAAKSEPSKTAETTATPSADGLDPSKLEIRVGLIVKCWNHPESDKLLCEEIDLGEGNCRTIASGLRAFYSAEEMQGRKVLVLANLKERPMAGFKSQGMVLCAIGEGHSVVRVLEPPATANVGDRVDIAGFAGEAAPANQVAKKKIFESLAPFFRANADGIPCWNNIPFTINGQQCVATLPNAVIS